MSGRTPAPWEAITDRRNSKDQELPPVVVTRADGWQNGQLVATMNVASRAAIYANARLIAAAPDLFDALAALVAAVERDDNPSDEGHDSNSDEMAAARQALAKAKGQS